MKPIDYQKQKNSKKYFINKIPNLFGKRIILANKSKPLSANRLLSKILLNILEIIKPGNKTPSFVKWLRQESNLHLDFRQKGVLSIILRSLEERSTFTCMLAFLFVLIKQWKKLEGVVLQEVVGVLPLTCQVGSNFLSPVTAGDLLTNTANKFHINKSNFYS